MILLSLGSRRSSSEQVHRVALGILIIAGTLLFCATLGSSTGLASTGPVAAYSFDEGEGEVAGDLTGNHDGALKGTEWAKGRYGSSLYFDGEGDKVEIPDSAALQLTEEFTLQAWVRPDDEKDESVVISKQASSSYSYQLFAGGNEAEEDGTPEGFLASAPSEWDDIEAEDPLQPNTWNHLALTYDGGSLRLYVNGELVNATESSLPAQASVGPLLLGANQDGEDFEGRIDEVRVYDRALSAGEVRPDITPPTVPGDLEAVLEPEEEAETEVSWDPSTDPAFSDGQAGSGVRDYSFRYRVGAGKWSTWETTSETSFVITGAKENDEIRVLVLATDVTGNISPIRAAKLLATHTLVTPENLGDEELNEHGSAILTPQSPNLGKFSSEEPSLLLEFDEQLCGANPSPCGKYNGRAAANYAIRWNLRGMGHEEARFRSNRNFDYFGGQGGDCTNYVSQALYNGGMRFMRANGRNDPDASNIEVRSDFEHGEDSWWSYFYLTNHGPFLQRDYEVTESWVRAEVLREQLLSNGLAKVVQPGERLKAGDVVFYNLHGLDMSEADHTQFVVRVGKRRAWVAQHSPGYRQTLRRVINRNDTPDHKLNVDWRFQVVRPLYTAANIQG